jgi:hypothetical protein
MIIPTNIIDCFTFLNVLVDEETKEAIKEKKREGLVDFLKDLGMFIRNNWLYSDESPLMRNFRSLGLADYGEGALVLLIIEQYWEYLNGCAFDKKVFVGKLKNTTKE